MPKKRNLKKQLDAFHAGEEQHASAKRKLCSVLFFWQVCGHKKCLRAKACVVDFKDCFDRLWPHVPEEVKITIRTEIKAGVARLSEAETVAAIERQLALYRATMAPREVPQTAEPAPQSSPIAPAAPNPRLRVL